MAFASSLLVHRIAQTVLLPQPLDVNFVHLVIRQHDVSRTHPEEKRYAEPTMGLSRQGQDTRH
jgi:hypothetical protein